MKTRLFATVALSAVVTAGASFAQETEAESAARLQDALAGGSSYGEFLAGRIAMAHGDTQTASRYLYASLDGSAGLVMPRERAFSAAILAGDIHEAASVELATPESSPAIVEARRMAQIVDAMVENQPRPMHRAIQAQPIMPPHAWAGALVSRWLAADAGDWNAALVETAADAPALARVFGGYHRALLLERRRRNDDADAQYQILIHDGAAAPIVRLAYGEFLERRGRRDEAVALYDMGLAQGPNVVLAVARQRALNRGRPPAAASIDQGAALALGHAAAAAAAAEAHELVVAYLRMSLELEPDSAEAWLMLGEALEELGMPVAAREAWASAPANGPAYTEARISLAASLDEAGQGDEALRIAREAVQGEAGLAAAYALASLLVRQEQYEQALQVLDSPPLTSVEEWGLYFLRGAAQERLGRRDQAQAAFQQALVLSPDQAEVLNYLGYMWIDGGERVQDGLAMVERAVTADPQSGSYQDSLGWGRYRQGEYEEAVRLLELAVSLSPESAEINDHLGDAYWQVGRRREAEYQWRRALALDPDEDIRAGAEAKLAGWVPPGTGAATP